MKSTVYIAVVVCLLASCTSVKKVLNAGSLTEKNFNEKTPFEFDKRVPVIAVTIAGKTYRFLFDTGAPTVLSAELAAALKLQVLTNSKTSDSQGHGKKEQVVVIPDMQIGGLHFKNTGALVVDTKKVFEMRCMQFDGIIGANQMAKAVWQLDYDKKEITVSNSMAAFTITDSTPIINFIPASAQQTPRVPVKIGDKTIYITFDTGGSGDLRLSQKNYASQVAGFKSVISTGSTGTGIYGGSNTVINQYVKLPSFSIGDIQLTNQVVEFSDGGSSYVGNEFFKHYKVILNWQQRKIYMLKQSDFNAASLSRFAIGIKYINNKPTITELFTNSEAAKAGLLLNDIIVTINGKDVTRLTEAETCHYAFNSILKDKETTDVTVLRNDKKINCTLKKVVLLD